MILGVTGHRPDKLPNIAALRRCVVAELGVLMPEHLNIGMAVGADQEIAEICVRLETSFTAVLPFEGQDRLWPVSVQRHYAALLSQARDVVYASLGAYSIEKMHIRNRWIVDHSTALLAVFDGSPGGTAHTVQYAIKRGWRIGHEITVIDPRRLESFD